MIIGYARVSTTEQNLGLRHDELKPAFYASVDPTRRAQQRHRSPQGE
jgi:DNA invertase Pin-like site-specific DNA recombinase